MKSFFLLIVASFVAGSLGSLTKFQTDVTVSTPPSKAFNWKSVTPCSIKNGGVTVAERQFAFLTKTSSNPTEAMYFFHPWNGCSKPPTGYSDGFGTKQFGSVPWEMEQELNKVICGYQLDPSLTNCAIQNNYIPAANKCDNAVLNFPIECADGPADGDAKVYSFSENVPEISLPHVKVEYFFDNQCSVESISKVAYFELNRCIKVSSYISGAFYKYAIIGNSGDWKFFIDQNCISSTANVNVFPDVSEYGKCELSSDPLSRQSVNGNPKQYYVVASVLGGGGEATKDNDLTIDQEISLSGLVVGLFLGALVVVFYGFSVFCKASPGYTQGKDVELTVA